MQERIIFGFYSFQTDFLVSGWWHILKALRVEIFEKYKPFSDLVNF